jgi:hypothetical protein
MYVCRYCNKRHTSTSRYYPCRFGDHRVLYMCRYRYDDMLVPFFKCTHTTCNNVVTESLLLCSKHLGISRQITCKNVCKWCFKLSYVNSDTACPLKVNNTLHHCRHNNDESKPFYKCTVQGCIHSIDLDSIMCSSHYQ